MKVKITNRRPYTLILDSTDPLVGMVRIGPSQTAEVELDEVPAWVKSLAEQGWAVVESVSEEKAAARATAPSAASSRKSFKKTTSIPKSSE